MSAVELPQAGGSCLAEEGCITCGDTALPMRVLDVDGESRLALCADEAGATEEVAIDLVGPLSPGDAVLVHARVALVRLELEVLR